MGLFSFLKRNKKVAAEDLEAAPVKLRPNAQPVTMFYHGVAISIQPQEADGRIEVRRVTPGKEAGEIFTQLVQIAGDFIHALPENSGRPEKARIKNVSGNQEWLQIYGMKSSEVQVLIDELAHIPLPPALDQVKNAVLLRPPGPLADIAAEPKKAVNMTYHGCEVTIMPPEKPGDAITVERITPGKEADGIFYHGLFEQMRDRGDLGLTPHPKNRTVDLGLGMTVDEKLHGSNQVSGFGERLWVRETSMSVVQAAIEKLAGEPLPEIKQPVVEPVSRPRAAQAAFATQAPVAQAPAAPKEKRPKAPKMPELVKQAEPPSVERVLQVLRGKKGEKLGDQSLGRMASMLYQAVRKDEDPRSVVDDRKRMDAFSAAERKAFQRAVHEVYSQKAR